MSLSSRPDVNLAVILLSLSGKNAVQRLAVVDHCALASAVSSLTGSYLFSFVGYIAGLLHPGPAVHAVSCDVV